MDIILSSTLRVKATIEIKRSAADFVIQFITMSKSMVKIYLTSCNEVITMSKGLFFELV